MTQVIMKMKKIVSIPLEIKVWLTIFSGLLFLYLGTREEKLIQNTVGETLVIVIYLTLLVGFTNLKMPIFFASRPRLSTFALITFSGHISLLFDSFAVILLLAKGIQYYPFKDGEDTFNQFMVKSSAMFTALTVGGAFYLGELWGLPWYLAHNQDTLLSGLSLLIVFTPVCLAIATFVAFSFPVKIKKVGFDKKQAFAMTEFIGGLAILIFTHDAILSLGSLIIYTLLRGKVLELINAGLHEVKDGALIPIGLIAGALVLNLLGVDTWLNLTGYQVGIVSALSSPLAGAIAIPVDNLEEFYFVLLALSVGAATFSFSSLVGILVLKGKLKREDLPEYLRWVPSFLLYEKCLYTLVVIPHITLLFVGSLLALNTGVLIELATFIGVSFWIYRFIYKFKKGFVSRILFLSFFVFYL